VGGGEKTDRKKPSLKKNHSGQQARNTRRREKLLRRVRSKEVEGNKNLQLSHIRKLGKKTPDDLWPWGRGVNEEKVSVSSDVKTKRSEKGKEKARQKEGSTTKTLEKPR